MLADLELRNLMYGTVFAALSAISLIFFHFLQLKKKKKIMSSLSVIIKTKINEASEKHKFLKHLSNDNLWAFIETLIVLVFCYVPVLFTNSFLGEKLDTGANYFGLIYMLPLFFAAMSLVLWINPIKQVDLIAPAYPLALSISKIACFCAGCCNSVWWPGGMYNYSTQREELPIQLIESGCAFAIFIFMLFYRKKAKPGTLYPIYMILYSATRFVSEFWRGQKMIFGNLRLYHMLCIIGVVLGVVYLLILKKYGEKITLYFDNTIYFSRKINRKFNSKKELKS